MWIDQFIHNFLITPARYDKISNNFSKLSVDLMRLLGVD